MPLVQYDNSSFNVNAVCVVSAELPDLSHRLHEICDDGFKPRLREDSSEVGNDSTSRAGGAEGRRYDQYQDILLNNSPALISIHTLRIML